MSKQKQLTQPPIDTHNGLMRQGQMQLGEPVSLVDIKDVEAGQWFEYAEDIFIRMNHYYDADSLSACVDMDGDVRFFRGTGKVVERYNVRFAVI